MLLYNCPKGTRQRTARHCKLRWLMFPGELLDDEYVDLVADSDGIYPDNMGAMAAEIFGISEE